MITFDTTLTFIGYTIFVIVYSFLMFILVSSIIDDRKSNKKSKKKVVKPPLKIGGIYGTIKPTDQNNPFSPIREYDYYVAILDIKPSRDGDCEYCQYVYLNDKMLPYLSYSDTIIYSNSSNYFDDWEYIKDIDLNTIKIS